ncbi:MAG: hypothetical protein CFE25_09030 [Chitinophagaceae bacterium BSSC1]|nr:MAG: hypothetical protein CFE25_09030 [Chitinophagaceae bacterium BSSC1]
MPAIVQHYQDSISTTQTQLSQLKKRISLVALLRLACFLVFAFTIYQLFHGVTTVNVIIALLSLAGFLASISWFVNLQNQQAALRSLLEVLQNELVCLEAGTNLFDNGAGFEDGQGYWSDLDIFGKGSLYHYLNRTSTIYGAQTLAGQLQKALEPEDIIQHQIAIASYGQQIKLVESMIAASRQRKTELVSLDKVADWLKTKNQLQAKKWLQILRYLIPVLNLFLLIHALISSNPGLLGLSFVLGWFIIGIHGKYLQSGFQAFENKQALLQQYGWLLEKFQDVDSQDSTLLRQYKESAQKASVAIAELTKLSNRIDQRLNLFAIMIFNPYLLFDIQNMWALENWKTKHQADFQFWLALVGKIELLNCFAVYRFQHPNDCTPTISDKPLYLSAKNLSHPLIAESKRVGNDLAMGSPEKLFLITGSNMSGKTTFLRAIGMNLVMAQAGLPVAATQFEFSPMQIFSSIRISDSLAENTSYFMAELKKLQALKIGVQSSTASLVLIDEILRGTNSEDKYHGSAEFVKELMAMECLSLFATHDLKLGAMEQDYPGILANYCFESLIENNNLFFDYTIRKGIAQNKNASFLMKQMGII